MTDEGVGGGVGQLKQSTGMTWNLLSAGALLGGHCENTQHRLGGPAVS